MREAKNIWQHISVAPDVYCVPSKGPLERPFGLMLSSLCYARSVAP